MGFLYTGKMGSLKEMPAKTSIVLSDRYTTPDRRQRGGLGQDGVILFFTAPLARRACCAGDPRRTTYAKE